MKRIIAKFLNEGFFGLMQSVIRFICVTEFVYRATLNKIEDIFYEKLSFVEMNLDNLKEIRSIYNSEIDSRKYDILYKRITNNSSDKPYLVKYEGKIAGYFHIAFEDNYDSCIKMNIQNTEGNIHLFDDYTFSDFRGKGVHGFSIFARKRIGFLKGYNTATVHIIRGNVFSEKAYMKNGFKAVEKISVWFLKIIQKKQITNSL